MLARPGSGVFATGLTGARRTRYDKPPVDNPARLLSGPALSAYSFEGSPMKFVRFQTGGQIKYGIIEGENIREIQGDLFGDHTPTGMVYAANTVKLLVPCTPSKLLALGLNYALHVAEGGTGRKAPERPEIFYKVPSSLCHPGDPILIPPGAGETHYEGELVAVIGKTAKRVSKEAALDYVFGYTCGNDVSARPWQRGDLQWWRGKSCDTFSPLGPWIETDITDPSTLTLETRLNGQVKQHAGTDQLLFDVPTCISFISQHVTLYPGDVIYTGTCEGVGPMDTGDTVEVEISHIGVLRNPVIRETA
ncbi:MAG: fumarylacetoacetate hydrolase family protein [Candidatus Tectimicrobiota bacterium]